MTVSSGNLDKYSYKRRYQTSKRNFLTLPCFGKHAPPQVPYFGFSLGDFVLWWSLILFFYQFYLFVFPSPVSPFHILCPKTILSTVSRIHNTIFKTPLYTILGWKLFKFSLAMYIREYCIYCILHIAYVCYILYIYQYNIIWSWLVAGCPRSHFLTPFP